MQRLFLFSIILILTFFNALSQSNNSLQPVVLELFTSQGCSSCPPADKLIDKIQSENEGAIIALSYHVDYWNYIGWKDPFSKKTFSDKQRNYASKFYTTSIYTPQVVVNGKEHFVGSNASVMSEKIKQYAKPKLNSNSIAISNLKRNDKGISINYTIEGQVDNKFLRLILVIRERETVVNRGENKNRTLKNSNIVVEEINVKLSSNTGTANIIIPDIITVSDDLAIVALLQSKNLEITGGTKIAI